MFLSGTVTRALSRYELFKVISTKFYSVNLVCNLTFFFESASHCLGYFYMAFGEWGMK
jgi:hypothetical protein